LGDPRHQLGIAAEEAVAGHLAAHGWLVLAQRWRCRFGELDLACIDREGALVGVEVRARRSSRAGSPVESIDRQRLHRLRSALVDFATTNEISARAFRVDLAAVEFAEAGWRVTIHAAIDAW
jgi:putative endonuclease